MTELSWFTPSLLQQLHTDGQLAYQSFGKFFGPNSCWVDRTQTINMPGKVKLLDVNKIPPATNSLLTLSECLDDSVNQLTINNEDVYLMWSGGIDSTLMIAAFIAAKKNFTIICNYDSIRENFNFYKDFIRGKYNIIATEYFIQELKTKIIKGIIVQAEHADLLFPLSITSQMCKILGNNFIHQRISKTNIEKFLKIKNYTEEESDIFYNLMIETSNRSPKPISTIADFAWWYNFNFRWQNNREKFRARINPKNDYRTFYSSTKFQQWSMQINNADIDDKTLFKKELANFTSDTDYIVNKIKWASMSKHFATNSACAITTTNELLFKVDIQEYYIEKNYFNGRSI